MHSLRQKNSGRKLAPQSDVRVGASARNVTHVTDEKAKQQKDEKMTIATWNVKTLLRPGKLTNVIMEAKRYNIDILGMSEVRWMGADRITQGEYEMIYSGGDKHERGVGILIARKLSKRVVEVIPMSDRVMAIIINNKPKPISVMQVYAPTTDHDDDEVEAFYEEIERVGKKLRLDGPVLLLGDFNAKVGAGKVGNSIGMHGLGQRNDRGERLIEFVEKNKLVVCNTIFQHHPRRLYTWVSPGGEYKNQIDYIMVNQRYRNSILNCHTCLAADCNTDHVMVKAECRVRLAKIHVIKNEKKRINTSPLKNKKIENEFSRRLQERTN